MGAGRVGCGKAGCGVQTRWARCCVWNLIYLNASRMPPTFSHFCYGTFTLKRHQCCRSDSKSLPECHQHSPQSIINVIKIWVDGPLDAPGTLQDDNCGICTPFLWSIGEHFDTKNQKKSSQMPTRTQSWFLDHVRSGKSMVFRPCHHADPRFLIIQKNMTFGTQKAL